MGATESIHDNYRAHSLEPELRHKRRLPSDEAESIPPLVITTESFYTAAKTQHSQM